MSADNMRKSAKGLGRLLGFSAGILVCVLVWVLPLQGLSREGRLCLAFTLMTVVWWGAQVAQPGYTSGVYLALLCLFQVEEPSVVFSGWLDPVLWLVPGAYLIAAAVQRSGLGERLSYFLILRFVRGWTSIIVTIFALTLGLSLLIPHPWPRAFLIMSVMKMVIKAARLPAHDATVVGFTVFAATVPTSLVFLTGDASINPLAASYAPEPVTFLRWFVVMGPPAILLTLLTLGIILAMFRPTAPVQVNLEQVRTEQQALGPVSKVELRTMAWVLTAVALWMSDGITGLDIGWTTLLVSMLMSMPVIGEVLRPEDWASVPVQVLIFLTAAISIGRTGTATGMNQWLADVILPETLPENVFLIGLLIACLSVVIHMFMGSVIAVMGVVIPALLSVTSGTGIPPLAVIGITYLCVSGHYLLPFHHLSILVGQGEENGKYTQRETLKISGPLLFALLITVVATIVWWKMIGLLK